MCNVSRETKAFSRLRMSMTSNLGLDVLGLGYVVILNHLEAMKLMINGNR